MLLREEEPVTDPPPVKTLLLAFLIMFQGPDFPRSMLEADGPIGMMQNKMETTIVYWGYILGLLYPYNGESNGKEHGNMKWKPQVPFKGYIGILPSIMEKSLVNLNTEPFSYCVILGLQWSFFPASWEFSETDGLLFAIICCVHPALVCSSE